VAASWPSSIRGEIGKQENYETQYDTISKGYCGYGGGSKEIMKRRREDENGEKKLGQSGSVISTCQLTTPFVI
jgi:hypothetical protein